ncbi:hypothetical protein BACCIP111883_03206 [Sutcliffiella rhizosphaerae]|uniref:Uncharacterized protein n=1 Tax=Sutcliffiella rhizosphaerae TaxID=2880967 RepID=A0ABM8YQZ6_9BACI|nr:hypothetical protein BACCIP111883_03206 [Sutcliffiella rhizosphaerae]
MIKTLQFGVFQCADKGTFLKLSDFYVDRSERREDSSKMLPHFHRAMNRYRSLPCPAGGRDMGNPRRQSPRRFPDRPRKAKRLQRRSTIKHLQIIWVCQQSETLQFGVFF